jgi:DNA polymerase I-like protein with 3'-5' exonuclease and polymerase domains
VSGGPHSSFVRRARSYIVPAPANTKRKGLVFDLEANGLLDTATKLHCIVIVDLDSDRVYEYGPERIDDGLKHLALADCLIGHNICDYDLPLSRKLRNWTPKAGCTIIDTLVASRLIFPHLRQIDDEVAAKGGPKLGKLRGSHKLEAWGGRLGSPKVGTDIEDWSEWTPEIQERCVGDATLSKAIFHFLQPDGRDPRALELEHRAAVTCGQISADGVLFDVGAAKQLGKRWQQRCAELAATLCMQFPQLKKVTRPRMIKLLQEQGWAPDELTEKGKPSLKNRTLENIAVAYPEFAGAAEYFILKWLISNMLTGPSAWVRHVQADGRIHAGLLHIGQPHGRASCKSPNLHGIPNPKKGAKFGGECRTLFHAPDGWAMVAADMANFQDRALAHYLVEFDGGKYVQRYMSGEDMHWSTAGALGFIDVDVARDKENSVHTALREGAKRFRYAFLFGGGATMLGRIIYETVRAVHNTEPDLMRRFFHSSTPLESVVNRVGAQALEQFMAAIPGLRKLRESIAKQVSQGWTPGLDGRRAALLSQHTSLNYLLVAAEAVVCKRWLVQVNDELNTRFGRDAYTALWVHDEIVVCCRPELAEQVGELLVRHAKEAGEHFKLKVPLDAEYKIGRNWAGEPLESVAPKMACAADADDRFDDGKNSRDDDEVDNDKRPQPAWSTPSSIEIPLGSAEFAAILASLSATDRAFVQTRETPRNGQDHSAHTSNGSGAWSNKFHCPFHAANGRGFDDTPSLHVYDDIEDPHYHCFGCGAHGPLSDLPEDLSAAATSSYNRGSNTTSDEQPGSTPAGNTETLAYAHRLWEQAEPITGTLAEQYLSEIRGIDIDALPPDIDEALRFHPKCSFDSGRHLCLLALFRDVETDEPAGIHRIALTPEAQKIDRRMLGRWPRPRAIKLWSLIRIEASGRPLYLGEGIETTLAAATRLRDPSRNRPMWPAWAAGSSGNIKRFPLVAGVEQLTLLVDRDATGEAAAAACRRAWKAAGRGVRLLRTQDPSLNDFNDLVRARLRAGS